MRRSQRSYAPQHRDLAAPQLTLRALATGMVLGALLTPCNVYSGLKIGWAFNMSIAAALLSFAFWRLLQGSAGTRPLGLLENNINQTTASSAASIISSGLVAPIPALALLTGKELPWTILAVWIFAVSIIGVLVAVPMRRQLILRDGLPFPAGVATAETVREIYAHGTEAMARVRVLAIAATVSAALKLYDSFVVALPKPPLLTPLPARGALSSAGVSTISAQNLGFVLDPSLLMVGFGAIIGLRVGVSLLLGAVLAWGVLGPVVLTLGWAEPGAPTADAFWFGSMVEWLLWPGVTLMVTASLTSFLLSARTWLRPSSAGNGTASSKAPAVHDEVPRGWFLSLLSVTAAFAVYAQMAFFDIVWIEAVLAVALTFVLALVAARVSGETGVTPIGAMGKITQLTFGLAVPGNVTTNLMAANVTGGAAGQCADLLHDLKAGLLLGASPRLQAVAQFFGVLTGSLAGSAAYLVLIPDPRAMLITEEWPAPAVATWKAVAEVLQAGLSALPEGSVGAMTIAFVAGIGFVVLGRVLPRRVAHWIPSAPALGLAFVIPAWNSISMFLGAAAAYLIGRWAKGWAERFLLALAAGLVAGESLAGVSHALSGLLAG